MKVYLTVWEQMGVSFDLNKAKGDLFEYASFQVTRLTLRSNDCASYCYVDSAEFDDETWYLVATWAFTDPRTFMGEEISHLHKQPFSGSTSAHSTIVAYIQNYYPRVFEELFVAGIVSHNPNINLFPDQPLFALVESWPILSKEYQCVDAFARQWNQRCLQRENLLECLQKLIK
eukprot:TRINITY_DN12724_c0_g1_i1.p1 TRINITY_DN12724_c0_g1~~TRINITY_DN12724_c0_g1_i1.p1  ORF type:complete len:174 (-),score=8.65 TRINITY_DN12724_c0_g1_i1:12-533(-)